MRAIVATIQPEQDEIVRAGLSGTVCIWETRGRATTAFGLHRVAYLLHAMRGSTGRDAGPEASVRQPAPHPSGRRARD
ncbi:hypothetical protein C3488_31235 [Streptomyces sp. Ru72]|nr:hypothetical protein [Streptomyces sp. Ru72]POX44930.1 hypothetical protein C3488_31235 [Streptomyces sp. Ru72]